MLEKRLSRSGFRGTRKHRREDAIHKDPTGALRAADLPTCLGSIEACCGAHHLGAAPAAQEHSVRLVPAQFVRPLVKSNENDYRDAEAIAEAVQRLRTRFVLINMKDQPDLQSLHSVRDRLVSHRTRLVNQIRDGLEGTWIGDASGSKIPPLLRNKFPQWGTAFSPVSSRGGPRTSLSPLPRA